ncbi:sugar phosphate isomerase/epimerase [Segetibacter sp. 3557_3]|uniref:sugar phosphate isomerase/epimerase family protein n=1 Tax=Segetibacter sp. 3557_3 TaxID=2547429 RepID=UPI001058C6D5|nr:sugar phosphate isomerase/epimerase [Segetibacter sp. 3557_3]TDH25637.1 sugar phosphate isomerase/epimerase [Segetibacter sp. 3557_3]
MPYQRRSFLKLAASLSSGLALTAIAGELAGCKSAAKATTGAKPLGLQLYTLKDDLPKNPKEVLKQVASYGYTQLESFEGGQGIFWGMSNKEFQKYIGGLGMSIVSSHCDINKDFERKAAESAEIGMKYLLSPHIGPQKTLDDYKRYAERFNQLGQVCKKAGLRFAYHNHDYTFKPLNGQLPQDVLMQQTDKDLVDFEMDIYWVITAGQDAEQWFTRYPNRFRLCHIKDRKKDVPATDIDASVAVGTGAIDFAKILKTAGQQGMQYYIVEQERYDNTTPLAAAKESALYIRQHLL